MPLMTFIKIASLFLGQRNNGYSSEIKNCCNLKGSILLLYNTAKCILGKRNCCRSVLFALFITFDVAALD